MFARLSSSKKEFGSCKRKEEEGAARPLPPTSEACSVVPIHAEYKAKARKKERLTNSPSVRPSAGIADFKVQNRVRRAAIRPRSNKQTTLTHSLTRRMREFEIKNADLRKKQ